MSGADNPVANALSRIDIQAIHQVPTAIDFTAMAAAQLTDPELQRLRETSTHSSFPTFLLKVLMIPLCMRFLQANNVLMFLQHFATLSLSICTRYLILVFVLLSISFHPTILANNKSSMIFTIFHSQSHTQTNVSGYVVKLQGGADTMDHCICHYHGSSPI